MINVRLSFQRILISFTLALIIFSGCGVKPKEYNYESTLRLDATFDGAWEATLRAVEEKELSIAATDKDSGLIVTNWNTVNRIYEGDYVYSSYDNDGLCDCGKPSWEYTYRGKFMKLSIVIEKAGDKETSIKIDSSCQTSLHDGWTGAHKGTFGCKSTGVLETDLIELIQARL